MRPSRRIRRGRRARRLGAAGAAGVGVEVVAGVVDAVVGGDGVVGGVVGGGCGGGFLCCAFVWVGGGMDGWDVMGGGVCNFLFLALWGRREGICFFSKGIKKIQRYEYQLGI